MRNKLVVALALSLLSASLVSTPSYAQEQHQNANAYASWDFSGEGGYWNIDQSLNVARKARYSFWANTWFWTGSDSGGYIGLQTDGQRFDGTTGDTAIFSLWNGTAAAGPSCGTFGGEGTGFSCRLAFPIRSDRWYRLRVWRVDSDEQGQWWGAWIKDKETGEDHYIGQIRVAPELTLMGPSRNFSEYFGPAVACDSVPLSVANWTRPTGNKARQTSSFAGRSKGSCTGGSVRGVEFDGRPGARIRLGGPL